MVLQNNKHNTQDTTHNSHNTQFAQHTTHDLHNGRTHPKANQPGSGQGEDSEKGGRGKTNDTTHEKSQVSE